MEKFQHFTLGGLQTRDVCQLVGESIHRLDVVLVHCQVDCRFICLDGGLVNYVLVTHFVANGDCGG